MEKYKDFQQTRKLKQLFAAVIFIAILTLGWQYPLLGYFIPLCMLFGLTLSAFRGRKWCDWYCPRGSFYEALAAPLSPKREIPGFFKNMFFRIGVLSILMLVMTFHLIKRWPDPYKIGMFFVTLITITTLTGIILTFIFHPRTWCMMCPIATMSYLIGKNKYLLKIDSGLCVECKLCAKVCPVQIKPYTFKGEGIQNVKDGNCLKCGLCVAVCPKKALSFPAS